MLVIYKALLFDLDGVLLDTERMGYEIWRDFVKKEAGLDLAVETYAKACGGSPEIFDELLEELLPGKTCEMGKYWSEEVVKRIREKRVVPVKGYWELLFFLKNYQGKKAIVTSNDAPWAKYYQEVFRFTDHFDVVINGSMVEKRKPEPDIYLKACEVLDVIPQECLAVEDSLWGILAAQRAGVHVLHMEGIPKIPEYVEKACVGMVRDLNGVLRFLQNPD